MLYNCLYTVKKKVIKSDDWWEGPETWQKSWMWVRQQWGMQSMKILGAFMALPLLESLWDKLCTLEHRTCTLDLHWLHWYVLRVRSLSQSDSRSGKAMNGEGGCGKALCVPTIFSTSPHGQNRASWIEENLDHFWPKGLWPPNTSILCLSKPLSRDRDDHLVRRPSQEGLPPLPVSSWSHCWCWKMIYWSDPV